MSRRQETLLPLGGYAVLSVLLFGLPVIGHLGSHIIASDQVDKTIEAITSAAKTGQIGDGKIFVINLDHAVRIRTGEADAAAL